jgi:glycosyltransferase involved in cell wall biosynthesis
MRILYFTQGQTPHDLRFLTALAQTNHRVAVLCLDHVLGRTWPEGIEELHWTGQGNRNTRTLVNDFRLLVKQFQPDVIHAGPIQKVAFIAACANMKPLVSMSWGSDLLKEADLSWRSRWITRFTLARTTILAADCRTVVRKAAEFGFKGPVKIFPWGVDLQHFTPGISGSLRRNLGWQDEFVFLSNRTLEPLYGVDVIAWAFISACQQNEHMRLLLYGKGSQETKLRALIDKAGLADRVFFGGVVSLDQLPEIYRSSNVYLSASHSDGSSVSLMEALACGKPVIVSDIPSNQEWVQNGVQGWLFRDGNSADLATRMTAAAVSTDLEKVSIRCRQLAEERADWNNNFDILLSAYEQAVQIGKHS